MSNPDAEKDPFLPEGEAAASDPIVLRGSVYEEYMETVDGYSQDREGISIYELAETKPRDAYVYLKGIFKDRYIDPTTESWDIGSPEEDGQMAFDGLTRYMAENAPPDPDIEEIQVVISVWKRNSLFTRMKTRSQYTVDEDINFTVGPQDLAF